MDADDRLIRSRYVGIYRAIAARSVRYLVVCVGATLLTALAVVVWLVPLLTPTFVTALPLPVAIAALLAVVFLAAGVIPTVLQLAITPRDLQRAFEAWNAFALLDKARWVRTAGKAPPTFRNPEAGLAWIAHHPLTDPLQRVRLLLWGGRFDDAAAELDRWPDNDEWPALRAQSVALRDFLQHGSSDLAEAEQATSRLPPDRADYVRLNLAIEAARNAHAAGKPWWPPLASARSEMKVVPRGASIGARVFSGLRTTAIVMVIGGAAGFIISFR